MMIYCEPMNMNMSLQTWTYEHDGIFLASFDDMDGICQEYFLPHWTESCWCGKIFYHMYTDGWRINENFGWKKYEKCYLLKKFA
jgi:hypothetical protein